MFTKGFEKIAVSLGWLNQRAAGGVTSRLGKMERKFSEMPSAASRTGARIGQAVDTAKKFRAATKGFKDSRSIGTKIKDAVKGSNPRTHFQDLSQGGKDALRASYKGINKAMPKVASAWGRPSWGKRYSKKVVEGTKAVGRHLKHNRHDYMMGTAALGSVGTAIGANRKRKGK